METAIIVALSSIAGILIGLFYKSTTGEQGATVNSASVQTTTQALASTSAAMTMYRELHDDFVKLVQRVETLETEREEMKQTIAEQNNKIARQDFIIADLTAKNAELQRQITENKESMGDEPHSP